MKSLLTRGRLLSGSAFVVASTVGLAAPAQAQCVITAGTVTCATADTTNVSNTGTTPSSDREYVLDTTTTGATATVSAGAAITGNGLAFTAAPGGAANDLTVTNNGSVSVIAGNTPTFGGTGALNVTGTGATNIVYTGTGSVTNLGAGNGLAFSQTGTGNLNATIGGDVSSAAGIGINAITDTGSQTIVVNSDVTGDTALSTTSSGTRTITIGTAGTLDGVNEAIAINGAGAATIANSGRIGSDNTDVAVRVNADADTTINNLTGGTINGSILLGAADDTVTNAGTINAGTMAFGAGTDLLTNQAGGTITVAGATPITGLETLNNAGTITAATGLTFDDGNTAFTNTGTLNVTGAIDLGAGTDSFANSGTGVLNLSGNASIVGAETFTNSGRTNLNNFTLTGTGAFTNTGTLDTSGNASLLGFTSFSNSGTLDLAPGTLTVPAAVFTNTGTILADEGAATVTGQTSFANSGTIDLQDGATGDVLTINSAFVGTGGSNLLVDFDGTAADRLVIVGAASGTTTVNANNIGAGLINLDGALVVDANTAAGGSFVLGTVGGNTSQLVNYSLVQNGGDFLLVAAPDQAAFDPLAVSSFGRGLWYQTADEVIAQTRLPAATIGGSFWGHVYLSRDRMDDDSTQTLDGVDFDVDRNMRTKRRGVQIGADYGFEGARVGLTGGYAFAKTRDRDSNDLGLKARGWNVGVYGQFGGVTGFHGELLAKHDRYKIDFTDGVFGFEDTKARANGVDGAIGFRFPIGGAATLDANAGVSFVRTKFDDIDAFGFGYDLDTVKSTRGRAGLRAVFGGSMSPYIDGTVYREFRGDGRATLFDGANLYDLETRGKATWFRVEGGILPNPTGLMLAAWADLGDKKGIGARLGFRFGGAAAADLPPPPPPVATVAPPPPPPATQACPDGSVILATDSCQPPPPPPQPAPERG
jgi:outer membrane autotransporter protein